MSEFRDFMQNVLVPASRGILLPAYAAMKNGTDINVLSKEDGSPASDADRAAEHILRQLIKQHYPAHGIIGEEYGCENTGAEYVWVLDPLDGTREFLAQEAGWGTLIGLLRNSRPVGGVIDAPLAAYCYSDEDRPSDKDSNRDSLVIACTNAASMFKNTEWDKKVQQLIAAGDLRPRLNCLGFAGVATGEIDVAIENGLKLHDIVALLPVLWQAGATCQTLEGIDYRDFTFEIDDSAANYSLITGAPAAIAHAKNIMGEV